MKPIWIVLISVIVSGALVGGSAYYIEKTKANAQKDDLNSQITTLQKQVKDLQTKSTASTSATTSTATTAATSTAAATDYLTTLKTFCDGQHGSENELKRYYYLENTDGKFGDCTIGQINGGAGFHLFSKIIDNQWTAIWHGNGFISQALVDQYKIPAEIAPLDMIQ